MRVDAQKVRDLMDRWTKAARMMSSLGIPLVQGLRLLVNGPSDQLAQLPEPDEDCVMGTGAGISGRPWISWRGRFPSPCRSLRPG